MDSAPLERGAPTDSLAPGRKWILLKKLSELGRDVVAFGNPQKLPVESEDHPAFGRTQPDRVLGQRLEDGLEIERGPPNDLEQLAGRRLLL
jgi:hypothetical protein